MSQSKDRIFSPDKEKPASLRHLLWPETSEFRKAPALENGYVTMAADGLAIAMIPKAGE